MDSPFDDPVPRGLRIVQATLRITTAVVCWGWAARYLHLKIASPVATLLQSWLTMTDPQVAKIEGITAYALIVVGLLSLVRPCWFVSFPAFLWLALAAIGMGFQAPAHKPLAAIEHGAGALAPLALILIDFWPPKLKFSLGMLASGLWLMRLAVSAALVAQGIHAVVQSHFGGEWQSVMRLAMEHLTSRQFGERDARFALSLLGVFDVAAGVSLLIRRSRLAALFATMWGIVAAGWFTVAAGETLYAETLIRAAMIGGPAALLCHWWLAIQEEPASVVARSDFR